MSEESVIEKLQKLAREAKAQKVAKREKLQKIKEEHYATEVLTKQKEFQEELERLVTTLCH